MKEIPVEKRFAVLCQITRAQHFAWRSAVEQLMPEIDPTQVVERMWEITGRETAQAYVPRIDPAQPLAAQVAQNIAWSSHCMGEEAVVEISEDGQEAFVRHHACPWQQWHARKKLTAEDRPGCDAWFRSTIDEINRALGVHLCFETLEALPEDGSSCLRRLWIASPP